MNTILKNKYKQQQFYFTDEETKWLLSNIGNSDPEIRDQLVFNLMANGIVSGGFTKSQFHFIVDYTTTHHLIYHRLEEKLPATLTRSFSALLNGFIIEADGLKNSPYYHHLPDEKREYFFETAIHYLQLETDQTGFSEEFGWVHSFAHGSDYLSKALLHDLFPAEKTNMIFDTLSQIICQMEKPFIDEEERRLAHIIYVGLANYKLTQKSVIDWISSFSFPLETNADFYRLTTFKNMLAYIYFHSLEHIQLDDALSKSMLDYLKDY